MIAQAQEWSSLTESFPAELAAAVPVALAAVGLFVGVMLAYKVVRRILGVDQRNDEWNRYVDEHEAERHSFTDEEYEEELERIREEYER